MNIPDLHAHAVVHGGTKLLAPPCSSPAEVEWLFEHKDEVIRELQAAQLNEEGFYVCLPNALQQEIANSPWLFVDLEATATSSFSTPRRVSKSATVCGMSWLHYRAKHPTVNLSSAVRPRALGIHSEAIGYCVFDLDALTTEDRIVLYQTVAGCSTLIGSHLCEILPWLYAKTDARPGLIVDVPLLFLHGRPAALFRPFRWAAMPNLAESGQALMLLKKHSRPSVDITYMAGCAQVISEFPLFEGHESWCLTELEVGHRRHIEAKLQTTMRVLDFVTKGTSIIDLPGHIRTNHPLYLTYQTALSRLVEAHVRGLNFDLPASFEESHRLEMQAQAIAQELAHHPALESFAGELKDVRMHGSSKLKSALNAIVPDESREAYCELHRQLLATKSAYRSVKGYAASASRDGRVHSLLEFRAITGRTTSKSPALQSVSTAQNVRRLFAAKAGNKIISIDFRGMEIAISAALADRAIVDVKRRIARGESSNFLRQLNAGAEQKEMAPWPYEQENGAASREALSNAELRWLGNTVLRRSEQIMEAALNQGVDCHLVTAADFARRAGRFSFTGTPLNWIMGKVEQSRQELGGNLASERQKAKAANFGLLYGMKAEGLHTSGVESYGLHWTLDDARSARQSWCELYPEFILWHRWTKEYCSRKCAREKFRFWDHEFVEPQHDVRIFTSATLSGRPTASFNSLNQALSYQSQGTGADILAHAIASLPEEESSMLLLPIHDELVLEAPSECAEDNARCVGEIMTRSASAILGDRFPMKVEVKIRDYWSK